MLSTPSLPDGSAYRSSSLPSLHLQAKGSECSLTARRRVAERTSPLERCCVGAHNSSSGPCVLNPSIERNAKFFTSHFCAAAKVLHRWLRRREGGSSSPPVNNFGGTISTRASRVPAGALAGWFPPRRHELLVKPATQSLLFQFHVVVGLEIEPQFGGRRPLIESSISLAKNRFVNVFCQRAKLLSGAGDVNPGAEAFHASSGLLPQFCNGNTSAGLAEWGRGFREDQGHLLVGFPFSPRKTRLCSAKSNARYRCSRLDFSPNCNHDPKSPALLRRIRVSASTRRWRRCREPSQSDWRGAGPAPKH